MDFITANTQRLRKERNSLQKRKPPGVFSQSGNHTGPGSLVYEDKNNPQRFHIALTSEDEQYAILVIMTAERFQGNALRYMDKPGQSFKPLIKEVSEYTFNLLIISAANFSSAQQRAKNYRLILIDPNDPSESNWKEFIPEKSEPMQSVGSAGARYL